MVRPKFFLSPQTPPPAFQQCWKKKYSLATEMSVGRNFRDALFVGQNKLTLSSRNTQVMALNERFSFRRKFP
jgi:hypothetical protein